MKGLSSYLFLTIMVVVFCLSFLIDWYIPLSVVLLATIMVSILDKLGKGIVLREMIALHAVIICLAMPALGYTIYPDADSLNGLWVKRMAVPQNVYFGFALPALTAFSIALCWPLNKGSKADHGENLQQSIDKVKQTLSRPFMKKVSIIIISVGMVMFVVNDFLPQELRFVFLLFFFAAFAGLLYVYYLPPFPYKWAILLGFALFVIFNALRSGMFTIVAYMGMTLFSFFFLNFRVSFLKKTLFFFTGAFILIVLQGVKPAYRNATWGGQYTGNKSELFVSLLSEQVSKEDLFSAKAFYPIYYRANQGFNISLVMRRIPDVQPYDNGKNLILSFSSSLVPRVLWPDKPEAGGKFNMKYYTGLTIKGWSTNVGPLGEAYGSFGEAGGILFMFLLGYLIRWVYSRVFLISKSIPLLVLWLPVLFYQVTYSAETDTLQICNSMIKSAFFIWILYKTTPSWFGIAKIRKIPIPRSGRALITPSLKPSTKRLQ